MTHAVTLQWGLLEALKAFSRGAFQTHGPYPLQAVVQDDSAALLSVSNRLEAEQSLNSTRCLVEIEVVYTLGLKEWSYLKSGINYFYSFFLRESHWCQSFFSWLLF